MTYSLTYDILSLPKGDYDKGDTEMLYVVRESDKKILWRDDAWDAECVNKANDFITYKGYFKVRREVTFNGDMVIYVKAL